MGFNSTFEGLIQIQSVVNLDTCFVNPYTECSYSRYRVFLIQIRGFVNPDTECC